MTFLIKCVTRDEFIHPCFLTQIMKYKVNFKRKHLHWWKMLEFKNSNETFWVIFKHCAFVAINAINFIIVIRLIFFILNAIWPFLGS